MFNVSADTDAFYESGGLFFLDCLLGGFWFYWTVTVEVDYDMQQRSLTGTKPEEKNIEKI